MIYKQPGDKLATEQPVYVSPDGLLAVILDPVNVPQFVPNHVYWKDTSEVDDSPALALMKSFLNAEVVVVMQDTH